MNNVIALTRNSAVQPLTLSYGRVVDGNEGRFHVMTEEGMLIGAGKADGCLLMPEAGDRVLVSRGGSSDAFILSVIVKYGTESRVDLKGAASIHADSIDLKALREVSVEAPEVAFTGVSGTAKFMDFAFRSRSCRTEIEKASVVVRFLDSVLERVTQRVRNSFRWIEDTEQIKAGRIRSIVNQRFSVNAKHASIHADEEVSVDGNKIHLG